MSMASSGALLDALQQFGLLTKPTLEALQHFGPVTQPHLEQPPHALQARCGDAPKLAKALGQRGWLTIYQINQLLLGRAKQLVYGPYHVLDSLGQGGLSQVFKARHSEH